MMNPATAKSGLRDDECAAAGSEHVVLRDMYVFVADEGVAAFAFVHADREVAQYIHPGCLGRHDEH